ncbi:MAG: hypothetical protein ASARMPRED_002428 [Alectoria sarmentosa]|nr:MAG: hypothetical protein ASARMPRED_002428 [Alectoria sarmentosa]
MANKLHNGTASSFLDAMVNLGDKPSRNSINTLLSSFCDLDEHQQDEVMENPKYWNALAKWGTEEDREEMSRRNVERLKADLEIAIDGVSTRRSAVVKAEATRLLATIPKEGPSSVDMEGNMQMVLGYFRLRRGNLETRVAMNDAITTSTFHSTLVTALGLYVLDQSKWLSYSSTPNISLPPKVCIAGSGGYEDLKHNALITLRSKLANSVTTIETGWLL